MNKTYHCAHGVNTVRIVDFTFGELQEEIATIGRALETTKQLTNWKKTLLVSEAVIERPVVSHEEREAISQLLEQKAKQLKEAWKLARKNRERRERQELEDRVARTLRSEMLAGFRKELKRRLAKVQKEHREQQATKKRVRRRKARDLGPLVPDILVSRHY